MAGEDKAVPVSPGTSEPDASQEKGGDREARAQHLSKAVTNNPHEFHESEGYVIDDSEEGEGVRYAEDGHTRLIPQPSDDPNDPLNWSWRKKHLILLVVAAAAFLPDYGSATGAVTLEAQAVYVFSFPLSADLRSCSTHTSWCE